MSKVYFSLGSNSGNRINNLNDCLNNLRAFYGNAIKTSSIYETAAWGFEGEAFLNQVVLFRINKEPKDILNDIQGIEIKMGRKRSEKRYISRIIDIDILFIDSIIYNTGNLIIPHPLIQDRRFVLEPLNEIASELEHPSLKLPVSIIYGKCKDDSLVLKYNP